MLRTRFAIAFLTVSCAAISSGQALPPPSYAGQSYWFGPGPSAYSLDSSSQTDGAFAEHAYLGGTYVATNGGGPAFQGSNDTASTFQSSFWVRTNFTIMPYIYVDGYFEVDANVHGFSPGTVNLGASRFYVLHNVGITIGSVFGFSDFQSLGGPLLVAHYSIDYHNYANPGAFSGSLPLNSATPFSFSVFQYQSDGLLEVNINRSVTVTTGIPAVPYTAGGDLYVSSM